MDLRLKNNRFWVKMLDGQLGASRVRFISIFHVSTRRFAAALRPSRDHIRLEPQFAGGEN